MRRPSVVLPVVALLLLAGCSSVSPFASSSPTGTPAPVPTGSSESPGPVYPPGIDDGGVHDASALVEAHESVIADTSYAVRATETHRYDNGTLQWRLGIRRRVAAGGDRHHSIVDVDGTAPGFGTLHNVTRIETYREEQQLYVVQSNATTERYLRVEPPEGGAILNRPLIVLFAATETEVGDRVTRNGTRMYRIEATRVTDRSLFAEAVALRPYDELRNASFDALVDTRGLVREYSLTYTVAREDGTVVHVNRSVRYRALGNTTVEQPPWYDEAVENTTGP